MIGAYMTHFRPPSSILISLSKLDTTHQDPLLYPLDPPRRPWEPKIQIQISGLRDPRVVGSDNAPRPSNRASQRANLLPILIFWTPQMNLNMSFLDSFRPLILDLISLSTLDTSFMDPFQTTLYGQNFINQTWEYFYEPISDHLKWF